MKPIVTVWNNTFYPWRQNKQLNIPWLTGWKVHTTGSKYGEKKFIHKIYTTQKTKKVREIWLGVGIYGKCKKKSSCNSDIKVGYLSRNMKWSFLHLKQFVETKAINSGGYITSKLSCDHRKSTSQPYCHLTLGNWHLTDTWCCDFYD